MAKSGARTGFWAKQARVGALLVVGLVLLVYAVILVGRIFDVFAERYTVITLLPSVAGLRTGAPVTLVLVGVPTPDMKIPDIPLIDVFGRGGALKSSWYGDCLPTRDFPVLIDLYLSGRFPHWAPPARDSPPACAACCRPRCCSLPPGGWPGTNALGAHPTCATCAQRH